MRLRSCEPGVVASGADGGSKSDFYVQPSAMQKKGKNKNKNKKNARSQSCAPQRTKSRAYLLAA
jgi:hypothetical protein